MKNFTVTFTLRSAHRHALWLRWVLLCTVFSALHGVLGAWVVPVVASEPLVEICTPSGMQWVALETSSGGNSPNDWPQGLAKPCVWASANTPAPPVLGDALLAGMLLRTQGTDPIPIAAMSAGLPSNAERVLLMAPMRAPPV